MDLVIRNGISDTTYTPIEVGIQDGKIVAVAPGSLPRADQEIDAEGGMISPAFLNPHFHLENALIWRDPINQSGTLQEAIDLYARVKREMPIEDILKRGAQALRLAIGYGTLWMSTRLAVCTCSKGSLSFGAAFPA
jgi:cytosine/creatinine deaminase